MAEHETLVGQNGGRKVHSDEFTADLTTDKEFHEEESVSNHQDDSGVQMSTPGDSSPHSPVCENGAEMHESDTKRRGHEAKKGIRWRAVIMMLILCLVNTLNYMDRYTLPAVLGAVMKHFSIDFAQTGLLQTVFVCSYMVVSPIFGYLGDHYNRVYIIAFGVGFWSAVTLASSFVPPEHFILFVLTRALVGVGEASYVTVAPSLIGDLFAGESRSTAIAVFSLTTPVGSGLGYVVGGFLFKLTGNWQWALRVTPIIGIASVIAALTVLKEPQRGAADRLAASASRRASERLDSEKAASALSDANATELQPLSTEESNGRADSHATEVSTANTKSCNGLRLWLKDVAYLLRIKTYVLVVLGFTSVCFVAGSVSWFGPSFANIAFQLNSAETGAPSRDNAWVSFLFGVVTCVAGVLGVVTGTTLAKLLRGRRKLDRRADALICGCGMFLAAPLLLATLIVPRYSFEGTWFVMMAGLVALFVTWPLVTDMMLYVIEPRRRASASGLEMLATHLFGDASSPYILGAVADLLATQFAAAYASLTYESSGNTTSLLSTSTTSSPFNYTIGNASWPTSASNTSALQANSAKFQALQYSLSVNAVIALLGCAAFFGAFVTILPDRKRLLERLNRLASPQKHRVA